MMLTAYRLAVRPYVGRAFAGEGARRAGGRWNPRGLPTVYTSTTLSLAALEFLVHLSGPQDAPALAFFRIEFEARLVQAADLPKRWRKLKVPATRALGRQWLENAASAVLRVPSFVVPSESNFVLNPLHPDFRKIKIGRPEHFALDPRLYSQKPV
jgi:RES domain-containing protein